jgi:SAM-dependent methyltransferase
MATQPKVTPLKDPPPHLVLLRMLSGYRISEAIYVAAKLGLADLLGDGARPSAELAKATGTHPPSLHRLMRLLASAGIFAEQEGGRFALTPVGACMRTGVPGSYLPAVLFVAGPTPIHHMWNDLLYSVETGKPAFDHLFGAGPFEYFAKHPEDSAIFNAAMASMTAQLAAAVPSAYDFSSFHTIMDVGGGFGVLLDSILKANPALRGILFEAPPAVEGARKYLEAAGLTARCEVIGGDFFKVVPRGADACILKNVIHDWDDEHSLAILKNCHRALTPGAKLLLVELLLPERIEPSPMSQIVAELDLTMMLGLAGRERTEREFAALLGEAGFKLKKIFPLETSLAKLIEAEWA